MMDEFNEGDFQNFMEGNQVRDETREYFELVRLRTQLFLSERGVEFPPENGFPDQWFDDDEQREERLDREQAIREGELGRELTDDEVVAMLEDFGRTVKGVYAHQQVLRNNLRHLNYLTADIVIFDKMQVEGKELIFEEFSKHKKQLQAQYKVEGLSAAWHELVNMELPGEALGPDDESLVDAAALAFFGASIEAKEQIEMNEKDIIATLNVTEDRELTVDERITVIALATMHAAGDSKRKDWQEESQLVLINMGVPISEGWLNVIVKLQEQGQLE